MSQQPHHVSGIDKQEEYCILAVERVPLEGTAGSEQDEAGEQHHAPIDEGDASHRERTYGRCRA